MSGSGSPLEALRARLAEHGYHLFLTPDRPSGWWVTIRNAEPTERPPVEARAATRDEALTVAERLFVSHRLVELDALLRGAGMTPPLWADHDQDAHLTQLVGMARSHKLGRTPG